MSVGYGDKARGCDRKAQYPSARSAKVAARRMMTLVGGRAMEAYRCPHCGWHHVGHRRRQAA